jgi:hypothetical protein
MTAPPAMVEQFASLLQQPGICFGIVCRRIDASASEHQPNEISVAAVCRTTGAPLAGVTTPARFMARRTTFDSASSRRNGRRAQCFERIRSYSVAQQGGS